MAKDKKGGCGCSSFLLFLIVAIVIKMSMGTSSTPSTATVTATPKVKAVQTAAPEKTLSMQEIKTLLEESLQGAADFYAVDADGTGMLVSMAFNGMYSEIQQIVAKGNAAHNQSWQSVKTNMVGFYNSLYGLIKTAGVKNTALMLNIVNDQNHDYVLLSIVNGQVIYDITKDTAK